MRKLFRPLALGTVVLSIVGSAGIVRTDGAEVIISTSNPSGLQGNSDVGFNASDVTSFDTLDHSIASIVLGTSGNLNAFHIRDNGNYLVSTQTEFTLGGGTFADGDIAEYNPATDAAITFMSLESILDPASDIDVDAFTELPDGRVAFSTLGEGALAVGPNAGLTFTENDVIVLDPATMAAAVLLSGNLLSGADRFINVSGISALADGRIAISASTGGVSDMVLGGISFQRNDAVIYDPLTGTANSIIEGSGVFEGPPNPSIDALHIVNAVPEVALGSLGLLLVLGGALSLCRTWSA